MKIIDRNILNTKFLLCIIFFPSLFFWLPNIIYLFLWGLLLAFIFFYNKFMKKDIFIFFFITFIIILNIIFFPQKKLIIYLYINFLFKCYPLYFICSKGINENHFIKIGYKFGIISNIFIFLENFVLKESSYMAFGYHLLPVLIIYIFYYFKYKKNFSIFLTLINTIFLIFYGNRGASLSLFIFIILYYFIFYKKIVKKIVYIFIMSNIILLIFAFKENINKFLIEGSLFIINNLNINSYFLSKLIMFLETGLSNSSSGRDILYNNAVLLGNQSWLFGNGIGSFRYIYETYPHNLFLEFYVQFGIFGLIVLIYFFIKIICSIVEYKNYRKIFLFLFILAIPRLILSSSFWERPEFWGLFGYMIFLKKLKRGKNGKKSIIKKYYIQI